MRKLVTLLFICLALMSNRSFSQDFEVPNYVLKEKEDYTKYEKDMIAAEKWLLATPVNEQTYKRKEVSAFVVDWVDGSPTVFCAVFAPIMDFENKNKGMLAMYMAATARYVLEKNYSKDFKAKQKFAIAELIKFYDANRRSLKKQWMKINSTNG